MKQRNMKRVKQYAIDATIDTVRCIYGIVTVAWWALVFLCTMPVLLIWSISGIIDMNTTSIQYPAHAKAHGERLDMHGKSGKR